VRKTSVSAEQNISESSSESFSLEKNDELTMRDTLTNALIYCKSLLREENLITNAPPEQISAASVAMDEEIFNEIMFMSLQDRKIIADEDLILREQSDVLNKEEYREVR